MHRELLAVILLTGCTGSGTVSTTTATSSSGTSGDTSAAGSGCGWPADLYDGGLGACIVGRALVECQYPVGVLCDSGPSAAGGGGLTQTCISDSTTSCSGCASSSGAATCTDRCAPNEYAISCGGLLAPPLPDGGTVTWTYQTAPTGCIGAGATPGGSTYYCCPCL